MMRLFVGSISVQIDFAKGMRRSPRWSSGVPPVSSKSVTTLQRAAGGVQNFATDQVGLIDFVAGQRSAFLEGDRDFGASQLFGI